MKILFIAPHQDDEIIAAGGLIQKCINSNDDFKILFATNGDYQGPHMALKRYYESKHAFTFLGGSEDNIFYLGYGDTGMNYSHSFLRRILFEKTTVPLVTPYSYKTYHPSGEKTVHAIRTNFESVFTQQNFLTDLEWFIKKNSPDVLIVPHYSDMHGDHAAIIPLLSKIDVFNQVSICLTYIIHSGNDALWPPRKGNFFTRPSLFTENLWKNRISIPLTPREQSKKSEAIALFVTQLQNDTNHFLSSFSKQEEIFFLFRNNEVNRQKIYSHFVRRENL